MSKSYMTQDVMKKKNLADIFTWIIERGQTTRREIEHETGFSWGAVSSYVALLVEKGYVIEEKRESGRTVGRTTYVLKPTPDGLACIGLDINRSGYSCEILGLDRQPKKSFTATFHAETQEGVIKEAEALYERAEAYCREAGLQIFSLGIALQGVVNGRAGLSLQFPDIPDWKETNIVSHFSEKYGIPVYLGHDPKCMLLGQMSRTSIKDCVLVRVDEGIGMAVALDGKIPDDTARMELGHIRMEAEGRLCHCGRRGCLEAYASLRGIAEQIGKDSASILREPERYTAELAAAGRYLAMAIYNTCIIFNPQRLILTGSGAGLSALVAATLRAADEGGIETTVDPAVSAAYGAAIEGIHSAIKAFYI